MINKGIHDEIYKDITNYANKMCYLLKPVIIRKLSFFYLYIIPIE